MDVRAFRRHTLPAMSSPKRSLPSLGARDVPSGPPTVDDARAALGGRVPRLARSRVASLARFRDTRGHDVEGVVVCETDRDLDVWIGDGRFVRIALDRAEFSTIPGDHGLADVAADALVFDALSEGQAVRFVSRDDHEREGVLAERCRYGALVSHDGRVFAVSFRRLWPREIGGA
jgi:hypothetical protein